MKKIFVFLLPLALLFGSCSKGTTTRKERINIVQGNELYNKGDYKGAIKKYAESLADNANSPEAAYNLGLAQLRLAEQTKNTSDSLSKKYEEAGENNLLMVSQMRGRAIPVASLALYNLGNRRFRNDKLDEAIALYTQSLRLTPDYDDARWNLRVAQLKQQQNQKDNQDKNQNQNQNQDQDKKDKNKDKDKQQQQQQQQQQQKQRMNEQTAAQIMQALDNKEKATRARLGKQGDREDTGTSHHTKQW